jgi:dihydroflavonol-4-reductase
VRVFVTGGSGFVGKPTVARLIEGGHEVRCLLRQASRADELERLGCETIYGDVTDKASVLEGMAGFEWVVNLASLYSFWEPNKDLYRQVNVEGTRNVMEAALEASVYKVVHVSSFVVWGKASRRPFDEETPFGPERFTEYARSKYEGDEEVWELYRRRGLPVVFLYPGIVLGAGDPKASGRYIEDLIEGRIPGMVFEDSAFTYVHVNDVAEAIARALGKEGNAGEKYLIGNQTFTQGEYTRMVCETSGASPPKRSIPGSAVMAMAWILTKVADLSGRPPRLGMSTDQMRNLRGGGAFEGGKAERELGLSYTPIGAAIEEEVASHKGKPEDGRIS